MNAAILSLLLCQAPLPSTEAVDKYPDLPHAAALNAFLFSADECNEQWDRHAAHMQFLDGLDPYIYPRKERWRIETEWRQELWLFLAQAKNPCQTEYGIRSALAVLRDRLGEERFWRGEMPTPFVPVEYPSPGD